MTVVDPDELRLPDQPRVAGPDDPPGKQVRAILDQQLRLVLQNEQTARVGLDPEGVHQLRVSVRRMRAAIKTVRPEFDALDGELRWFGNMLGTMRDFDVLLDRLHSETADFPTTERAAAEKLLRRLTDDRTRARAKMLEALDSDRYRALLHALADAAGSEPAPAATEQAAAAAPEQDPIAVVRKPYLKLTKAARRLGENPPDDDLHRLRIRGKRLRYAAELSGQRRLKPLVKAAKDLQTVLGEHQDAVIAEQEVRRLLDEFGNEVDLDIVFVAGRIVQGEQDRRAACRAAWRAIMATVDEQAKALLW